jgi:hypothetical protein
MKQLLAILNFDQGLVGLTLDWFVFLHLCVKLKDFIVVSHFLNIERIISKYVGPISLSLRNREQMRLIPTQTPITVLAVTETPNDAVTAHFSTIISTVNSRNFICNNTPLGVHLWLVTHW